MFYDLMENDPKNQTFSYIIYYMRKYIRMVVPLLFITGLLIVFIPYLG